MSLYFKYYTLKIFLIIYNFIFPLHGTLSVLDFGKTFSSRNPLLVTSNLPLSKKKKKKTSPPHFPCSSVNLIL